MTQSVDNSEASIAGVIRDPITVGNLLRVNADGSINATITGGGAAASALFPQVASVNLTSAQILNLFTTPVTIVAAPAAGKMIQVLSINYSLTFVTTAYTVGGAQAGLWYGTPAGQAVDTNAKSILNAAASSHVGQPAPTTITGTGNTPSNLAALAVVFGTVTSNPTTGDGTFRVTVTYITVTL